MAVKKITRHGALKRSYSAPARKPRKDTLMYRYAKGQQRRLVKVISVLDQHHEFIETLRVYGKLSDDDARCAVTLLHRYNGVKS